MFFLLYTGRLKIKQFIIEKLSAREKDLLVLVFLFCQVLLVCRVDFQAHLDDKTFVNVRRMLL